MKFTVGQSLYYVPVRGVPRYLRVSKVGKRWLQFEGVKFYVDRHTLDVRPSKGFSTPGKCWLSLEDYQRAQRRHGAWRLFRRQVQDKWGPPENVTLEQIQAAANLLRLSA